MQGTKYCSNQAVTLASGANDTSACPIFGCDKLGVEMQTFSNFISTTTCAVGIKVCSTETGTYRQLYELDAGVSTLVAASASTGNFMFSFNQAQGYNFMKLNFSNTCTLATSVNVYKMI